MQLFARKNRLLRMTPTFMSFLFRISQNFKIGNDDL
jgi:hypothetical protein